MDVVEGRRKLVIGYDPFSHDDSSRARHRNLLTEKQWIPIQIWGPTTHKKGRDMSLMNDTAWLHYTTRV